MPQRRKGPGHPTVTHCHRLCCAGRRGCDGGQPSPAQQASQAPPRAGCNRKGRGHADDAASCRSKTTQRRTHARTMCGLWRRNKCACVLRLRPPALLLFWGFMRSGSQPASQPEPDSVTIAVLVGPAWRAKQTPTSSMRDSPACLSSLRSAANRSPIGWREPATTCS